MCQTLPNTILFCVYSPEELMAFGEQLAKKLQAGMTILLHGELGAGKTTLTKGLAKGLGIKRVVKSPTYTLIREYTDGNYPLYHMDVYRLEDSGGDSLGFYEYFNGEGIAVVEWSQFIQDDLPDSHLDIYLEHVPSNETVRQVELQATGEVYQMLINELKAEQL